jgi:hypothetical protein
VDAVAARGPVHNVAPTLPALVGHFLPTLGVVLHLVAAAVHHRIDLFAGLLALLRDEFFALPGAAGQLFPGLAAGFRGKQNTQ